MKLTRILRNWHREFGNRRFLVFAIPKTNVRVKINVIFCARVTTENFVHSLLIRCAGEFPKNPLTMSRYSANTTKTCRSESNTRVARECNCYDSLKKFKHNLQTLEPHSRKCNTGNTKPCTKKTPPSTGRNLKNENWDRQHDRSPPRPAADQKKTWFQVLVNSPKKAKPEKLLLTARNKVDIPCKYAAALTTNVENVKENLYPKNEEMKRIHLLVDMIHDKINCPSN